MRAMPDLSQPWPFGLSRRRAPVLALVLVILLAVFSLGDAFVSGVARGWPEAVVGVFGWYTDLGRSEWILFPTLGFALLTGLLSLVIAQTTPRTALRQMTSLYAFLFIGVGLPGLLSAILKRVIGRARPILADSAGTFAFHPFGNDWQWQSFPSGHATTIFALAFCIGFISPRWFWPSFAVAVAVGLSRIPLGMHYPTDVLGGAVLGIVGAYAARLFFAKRSWSFRRLPDGTVLPRSLAAVRRLAQPRRSRGSAAVPPRGRP